MGFRVYFICKSLWTMERQRSEDAILGTGVGVGTLQKWTVKSNIHWTYNIICHYLDVTKANFQAYYA
jgi:hypothetical protein